MKKKFNITGGCAPGKHYMVNLEGKAKEIFPLIESGQYFSINRPRQYGKTTLLFYLFLELQKKEEYFPIKISFEGIGSEGYESTATFIEGFFLCLKKFFRMNQVEEGLQFLEKTGEIKKFSQLDEWISELILILGKKEVVLIIDEVDKSMNNQLFLDFLGLLRTKYLLRNEGQDITFHSVILAGVHDVKTLKLKLRKEEEAKFNSPWNIATDFMTDLSFHPKEIETMLQDFNADKKSNLIFPK